MAKSTPLALLFITLLVASSADFGSATRTAAGTTGVEFIKASCSVTAYPRLCYASLSTQATAIQQSPKLLADAALSLSLNSARSTAADMAELLKWSSIRPREVRAMRDCVDQLADSVDRLRRSAAELNLINKRHSDFWLIMEDIQTWVSAALTDEDTCMDGFADRPTTCEVKTAVRRRISRVAHMTSNALALINYYAEIHG
ncbi:pectinesterase inhibitor 7-like [Primulina eburnea]|uniref:pectinesterase inhibitor 7-like n=1 Tax=Primulina eburnea TaxID=1245227 RepID=UPI003C6C2CEA